MDDHVLEGSRLPEDAAHRVLARAVELDVTRGTELTIAQLRAAAREAGISNAAFDAALNEWQLADVAPVAPRAAPTSVRAWFGAQVAAIGRALYAAPVRNLVALAAFWGVLMLLVSFDRAADVHWLVRKGTDPVALAISAVIALRLRARPIGLLLAGLTISQGAEFVMDAALGVPSVQGFGSHLALMIAGVAGVLLGGRLIHRSSGERASVATAATLALPSTESASPSAEQRRALTLRFDGA